MDEEITAEWARKTAKEVHGVKVKEQLEKCATNIKIAVSQNKTSTTVGIYGEELTIKELEGRGFIVKQHDDQRDGTWLEIKW